MDSARRQQDHLRMVDAKARMIDLLAEGVSVKEALVQIGRHQKTYDYWRSRDSIFARNATNARLGTKDRKLKGAPFIDFRRTFFNHDTPWHHAHMLEAMEKTPPGGITMILAPPECLAGSTRVKLNRAGRGFETTLAQLHHSFHGGVTQGRSWDLTIPTMIGRDDGGVRRLGMIAEVVAAGVKPTFVVTTETGRQIRASAEHRFCTPDEFVALRDLVAGMTIFVEDGQGRERQARVFYKDTGTRFHPRQRPGHGGWRMPVHRLVMEAHLNAVAYDAFLAALRNDPIRCKEFVFLAPTDVVHHLDGNRRNNDLDNLALTTHTAHGLTHADETTNNCLYQIRTDRIVSIEPFGEEPTFDVCMADEPHNFIADDFVVHNSGKTTFFVDYCCWRIALNPDYRVGFISESSGHARKLVGQIARRMTDTEQFPNFIRRYGPFYEGRSGGKTWTQNQLLVAASGHDEKDPTVEARGAGAQIYGARLDDIVFDDIQSTQSLNETEKLLRYFRQDALTRIKQGRLFIIGTRVGPGDFYETLMDLLPSMQVVKIRALDTGPEGLGPFTSYWPEHWPLEELLQRKEMLDRLGGDTWARVYQQDPVSEATATFTTEALANARTKERRIGQPAGVEVIMSLDPNLGVGVNALTVWGMDANRLYLIDIATRSKVARTEDIVSFLGEYASKYRPTTLIIEHNRERGLPTDEWLVSASKHYGFRIKTHQTSGNKINPIYGVASMAGGFSHGEISLPDMDEESRERLVPYMQELIAWRPDVPTKLLKQDLVMSGWFAWLHWLEHKDAIANRNRPRQLWRPSWLVSA